MDAQTHWEKIYSEKAPNAVSWYRPHLESSLSLIERACCGSHSAIIDVGGGESTLVDDLLDRGFENVTVLDISQNAIDASRKRLQKASERPLARGRYRQCRIGSLRLRCVARPCRI